MRALLRKFFQAPPETAAHRTYIALVAQARNPFFYETLGVPDTIDGRFEMVLLHLFLIQHRLLAEPGAEAVEFSRQLGESFFVDMDQSVRELGVSDSGVRYRIKSMAKAYHGRLQAYSAACAEPETLRAALARNLYGTVAEGNVQHLDGMAAYLTSTQHSLAALPASSILEGKVNWPPLAA